jgi:aquaporin Z
VAGKTAGEELPPDNQGDHRTAWLALEYPAMGDFDDPKLEWRRLFSEILGTFFLVLVAAGAGLLHISNGDQVSLAAAVVAPGLMVMAIILFMGSVSGAHLNPGVSIAFALRRDFPWRRVPGYIAAQLFGAVLATPGEGFVAWQALLIEAVLTFGLVSVILGTASGAQNVGALGAIAVGGYIALAGLWGAPVSGASMNTARSFGPAVISGDFTSFWVYVAGPLAGMLLAVGCAFILRGAGGSNISLMAGSGRLGRELRLKERDESDVDSEVGS